MSAYRLKGITFNPTSCVYAALKGQQWLPLAYLANILLLDSQAQAQALCEAYSLTVSPMPDGTDRGVCLDKVRSDQVAHSRAP